MIEKELVVYIYDPAFYLEHGEDYGISVATAVTFDRMATDSPGKYIAIAFLDAQMPEAGDEQLVQAAIERLKAERKEVIAKQQQELGRIDNRIAKLQALPAPNHE